MSAPVQDLATAPVAARAPLRFVSAASLFDGHDAAINMIRRLLQARGAEVVHLGHNRSVADIVRAAIQEDVDAIAVSSYQGGHNEYFTYMVDMLRERGYGHIRVVVGGGGTISPAEIAALEHHGIEKIYTPEDGRRLGLAGMMDDVFARVAAAAKPPYELRPLNARDQGLVARSISVLEGAAGEDAQAEQLRRTLARSRHKVPVVGVTGTGGAGKSSLTDELLARLVRHFPAAQIAVVAMDPTRRRSGGALLGDRIRMNSLSSDHIFMRSLATRRAHLATAAVLKDVIALYKACGFDLVIVETAGIGQSDSEIVDLTDLSLYVMTSEYGAASQLEKIDMLDFADFIVLNKAEKRGAEDALRDVRKQWRRNHHERAQLADAALPVFPTIASRFNDPGVNRLFAALSAALEAKHIGTASWRVADPGPTELGARAPLIPGPRGRYLAEIAHAGRGARARLEAQSEAARRAFGMYESLKALHDAPLPAPLERYAPEALAEKSVDATRRELRAAYHRSLDEMGAEAVAELKAWPERMRGGDRRDLFLQGARSPGEGRELHREPGTFAGAEARGAAFPRLGRGTAFHPHGEPARLLPVHRRRLSLPPRGGGSDADVRRRRRTRSAPTGASTTSRMVTARGSRPRSTPPRLYGEDPDTRPDIYGRTGNSGVSIATLDDMKKLYSGFDLCAPSTSVSMTINGPAPMLLAMFMNTAIDQQVERHLKAQGEWAEAGRRIAALHAQAQARGVAPPAYRGALPQGHEGSGLALLGVSGDQLLEPEVYERIRQQALQAVRGTVQADILKEDQAQNTCIFSTEFALRMMGDVQQYFIDQRVRNFYSVSISGYHIAEAGANPLTQLAFTLANGFTIVEYYLARGMQIDDFAPNLSFFFSNGMDPEYAVIGRVARRIWARALRERYHAGARSQMLKYHMQTSGRSLHAREISFNDIRTTLQALYALFDNCNSLHTNAYDEALTTPTEESVRRAVAIQLIINRELGLNKIQNPWQGSFAIDYLTDLVEEAVYKEFEALSERGGVLGAMETMYQRGKIQEESLYYETRKHDGSLPIVGVNTFLSEADNSSELKGAALIRSTEEEKQDQVAAVRAFQARNAPRAPAALSALQQGAASGANVFAELMEAVKVCSLGQITRALYQVGGQYRRNM